MDPPSDRSLSTENSCRRLAVARRVRAACYRERCRSRRNVRSRLSGNLAANGEPWLTATPIAPSWPPGRIEQPGLVAARRGMLRMLLGGGSDPGCIGRRPRAVARDGGPEKLGAWLMATAKRRALGSSARNRMPSARNGCPRIRAEQRIICRSGTQAWTMTSGTRCCG